MTRQQWTDAVMTAAFGLIVVGLLYGMFRFASCQAHADGGACIPCPYPPDPTLIYGGPVDPAPAPHSLSKRVSAQPQPETQPTPATAGALRIIGNLTVHPGDEISWGIAIKDLDAPLTAISVWVDVPPVVSAVMFANPPPQRTVIGRAEEGAVLGNEQVRIAMIDLRGEPILLPGTMLLGAINGIIAPDAAPGDYPIRAAEQTAAYGPRHYLLTEARAVLHVVPKTGE